jgi:predicted DNA-binding transcriptional regulator YafY
LAIRGARRVRFGYRSHSAADTQREMEPYAVVHTDGRWYLIGFCLARQALRTFRLDRISDLEICTEAFEHPAKFDAKEYLEAHMPFVQSDYQIDVWIDMPIEEADRTFAPWRVVAEKDGDGTRLRCGRDQLDMFAAMLLSMGRSIVVHNPPELRQVFRDLAQRATRAAELEEIPVL